MRATWGSALRTLDGSYTNTLCMSWCSMLQGLAPSLEHQPRASAARLLALYTPDWWRSNPYLHSERYATQTLLGMFSVLANSVQLSPQLGGVRNGEMENVTRVPPRLLPQSNPRSPLPLVVVGRTISPAPARPGGGCDRTIARKITRCTPPDRPLSCKIGVYR